jgi:DNA recombination protein RmuC
MASDALNSNNRAFLQIAQETLKRFQSEAKGDLDARQKAVADLVTPVRESLSKVDAQIQQMEKDRVDAYSGLREQVQSLIVTQKELHSQTGNLVKRAAHSECARDAGEKSNCGAWSRLRACFPIAISPSRKR